MGLLLLIFVIIATALMLIETFLRGHPLFTLLLSLIFAIGWVMNR